MTTLDSVLITSELRSREARLPDYAAENRILVSLVRDMARSPGEILRSLVQAAMTSCNAGSAAISLLDEDGMSFRWHALVGELAPHLHLTAPRSFSPCGTVVDSGAIQLFRHLERHFTYFSNVQPAIVEALLVPFSFADRPVGTIWVMTHDGQRRFDAEDVRLIEHLGRFAAAAYQAHAALVRAEEAGRHKDEFLAMLSHELRNPLAAMQLVADLFADKRGDSPEVKRASGIMRRQVMHLDRLIGDAVDVARIASHKLTLRKERIALADIVERAIEVSQPMIDAASHSLSVTLPSYPVLVDADATRLIQVLGNLLNNAAKFTAGRGHLRVSVGADGAEATIRVQDNGMGIAPGMLGAIFDLYAQVSPAGEDAHAGLGIGLALSRSLIEMHGGRLEAYSAGLHKGSEFLVHLPLPATPARQPEAISPPPGDAPPQLRILVVDDHRDTADALAWVLHSIGHEARAAYDGLSALKAVEERAPDVVIQDLQLPHMNGYQIARQIRERPAAKDALLVAVTAYPHIPPPAGEVVAFDHFLLKPVGLTALQEVLSAVSSRFAGRSAAMG